MYGAAVNAYRKVSLTTIQEPEKIVKLLFEAAIKELNLAKANIEAPRYLGRHIGKAIVIISELQAGLNFEKGGEAAEFLNGLYSAIIRELSKVRGKEEIEIIELSIRYLSQLKKLWEEYVLGKNGNNTKHGHDYSQEQGIMSR